MAVPGDALAKIPAESTLSFAQVAALVCTGTTSWNVLYGNLPLKPGQTVLFSAPEACPSRACCSPRPRA